MTVCVKIRNFKSIIETELKLQTGVNILIGPNGVGKTCILKSLMFIRDLLNEGVIQAVAKNGGFSRVYHRNQPPKISFSIKIDYGKRIFQRLEHPHELIWDFEVEQLNIKGDLIPIIKKEKVSINAIKDITSIPVFAININRYTNKNLIKIVYPDSNISGKDLFSSYESSLTKKELYDEFHNELKKHEDYYKKCSNSSIITMLLGIDTKINLLHSIFTNLNEYSISPDIAREEGEFLPYAEMLPNGKGLSNVIYALEKKNYNTIQSDKRQQNQYYYDRRRFMLGRGYMHRPYWSYTFLSKERYAKALNNINTEIAKAVKPINKVVATITVQMVKNY